MLARHVSALLIAAVFAAPGLATAAGNRPVDIPERARGASSVVVARAVEVSPVWQANEHGDLLIVSQVHLQVEETLKGGPAASVWMSVEGGTLNGVTLRVSSLPAMAVGDRAVFFVDELPDGRRVPHLKGLGILKLDDTDQVRGSSLHLRDVRALVQRAGR